VSAPALLEEARRRGVELRLEGGRLRYRAPAGALTAELREALRAHREELLELLRETGPPHSHTDLLAQAELLEARHQLGAVLLSSRLLDRELWVVLRPRMLETLEAEEDGRSSPRPVLRVEDVLRVSEMPPEDRLPLLRTLAAFPGARVQS
jgi:hypothetical protein